MIRALRIAKRPYPFHIGGFVAGTAAGIALLMAGLFLTSCSSERASEEKKDANVSAASSEARSPKPEARPTLLAESVAVRPASSANVVTISGQVEPFAVATVSAEVAARVLSRPLQRGDAVAAGGLLVALDESSARATLDQAIASEAQAGAARRQLENEYARVAVETDAAKEQAQAQLAQANAGERKTRTYTRQQELKQAQASLTQAETEEKLARLEADRYRRLVEAGAVAQQVLDQKSAALDVTVARCESAAQSVSLAKEGARQEDIDSATAQSASARAAVRSADTRPARLAALREQIAGLKAQEAQAAAAVRSARIALAKHRIASPFPARVLETRIEVGEMASPGSPVMKIGDIRRVKAVFAVPEASRPLLQEGKNVTITADTLTGKTFPGRVRTLGYEADNRSRTFPVEIMVENPREQLLPGMVTRLALSTPAATATVIIPVSAVASDEQGSHVMLLTNGVASRRAVTLGSPVGTDSVEVVHGLAMGNVIARTPQRLTDGAKIRLASR